jgi:hypothetical protein
MADAVQSARELYESDATFRAGIAAWAAERRCDLKLVDLLLEYGLTIQAECARWAATQPDRPFPQNGDRRITCGPFPCIHAGVYYWFDCGSSDTVHDAHDIPREHLGRTVNYQTHKFKSAAAAILFLLDIWDQPPPDRTEKPRPKRPRKPRPTAEPKAPKKPTTKKPKK